MQKVQTDRRLSERRLCNRVCFARPNGSGMGVTWGVTLHDLSESGISLILKCRLNRGDVVLVQPFRHVGAEVLVARVVRRETTDDGRWLYGCELTQPLSTEALERWVHEYGGHG
jgi:hypothetical protein